MSVIEQYFKEVHDPKGHVFYIRKLDSKTYPKYYFDTLSEELLEEIGSGKISPQFLVD